MPSDPEIHSAPSDLLSRLVAALVLGPVAIAVAWVGSWAYAGLVTLCAAIVIDEWLMICGGRTNMGLQGLILIAMGAVAYLALNQEPLAAFAVVAATALVMAALRPKLPVWAGLGVLYAGLPAIAVMLLRTDPQDGFAATLWLFATVWATDSGAYASGRLIGGPKLWPRVSPKKTWAGFVGGLVAAGAVGAVAAWWIGETSLPALVGVGIAISLVAQGGDIFESGLKRNFGVKDSGRLIPGHGGLMDRVDGLVAAALAAAGIGLLRAGPDLAGSGLLHW